VNSFGQFQKSTTNSIALRIPSPLLIKNMTEAQTIESLETADLSKHKHGDRVLCPCCGYPATLDSEGNELNFEDSCWLFEGEWFCVLMTMK
jgi:hypothetical protein